MILSQKSTTKGKAGRRQWAYLAGKHLPGGRKNRGGEREREARKIKLIIMLKMTVILIIANIH